MQKVFLPANILLPVSNMEKWSVIACDQYTSDKNYWDKVAKNVGDAPSALKITLPEFYLEDNSEERINSINRNMLKYINDGVFTQYSDSYIYVERTQSDGRIRKGIVGMADLTEYDYHKGANSLIRATEATVISRIPPRVKIRKDAVLELPHIMLLADNPDNYVFDKASELKQKVVYDFDLMCGGGHITGYLIDGENAKALKEAFDVLIKEGENNLMFAVGDGNHSLATAKECYDLSPNPLNRYALCEVVNIHDTALDFEPIYRVLFNVNPEKFIEKLVNDFGGEYNGNDAQIFTCIYKDNKKQISLKPTTALAVGTLQKYLDEKASDIKIDYIHDEKAVYGLCENDNTLGFIFNGMQKSELFDAVKKDGALPRKTFSMGHADDKRFYIEARKIK